MNPHRQTSLRTWLRGITMPILMSIVVAAALVVEQGLAVAAVLGGAGVILLVVRAVAPDDNPLRDVGEVVLRGGEAEGEWLEAFQRKRREANERKLRAWRKNAWGAWLVIAAVGIVLVRLVIVAFWMW